MPCGSVSTFDCVLHKIMCAVVLNTFQQVGLYILSKGYLKDISSEPGPCMRISDSVTLNMLQKTTTG